MKQVFAALTVSLILLFIFLSNVAEPADRPKLIVGGDHENPPYEYIENGRPTGFNVELMRAVADVVGVDVEFSLAPWSQVRDELEQGKIDALAGMYYSEERNRLVDFSVPHTLVTAGLFVRRGSPVRTIEDMKGKEVIVQKGDAADDYLRKEGTASRIIEVENPADVLRLLASGRHDCALMSSRFQGEYLLKSLGISNVRAMSAGLPQLHYCFAVKKGNTPLKYRLDEGLNILKVNGKYKEIYDKWFGVYEKQRLRGTIRYFVWSLAIIAGLLAASFIWSWILRREVRKRTAALRESEGRLHTLVHTLPDLVWLKDRNGVFLSCNSMFERLYNAPEAVIVGKTDYDFVDRELADFFTINDRKAIAAGKPTINEEWLTFADDGHRALMETIKTPVYDDGGGLIGVLGIGRDITQRKQAEEELRESEDKFRVLAETSPAAICVYQEEYHVYVNAAMICLTGYFEQELMEMRFWDWMHPDYKELVRERGLARQRGEQVPSRYEIRCLTKKGEEKWILVSAGRIEYKGTPASIVTLFDITERRRMEDELREAHDELEIRVEERTAELAETVQALQLSQFCIDKAGIGIFQCDETGTIYSVNEHACKSLGYSREELCALSVFDIDSEITREKMLELKEILDEKGTATCYTTHRRKDGSTFPVEITANDLDFHGKRYGISFVKDITEHKRAEEALKEREALLKLAMDLAKMGAWEYDAGTGLFSFNNQFYALYGTTVEREGGPLMPVEIYTRKFIPPEESSVVADGIEHALANSYLQVEHRIIRADGEERFIIVRGEAVFDQEGRFVKIRGANQDITDRKLAEDAIRESRAKYQAIVDNFEGYIYICSQDYRIEFMNNKLIERTGYDATGEFCYKVMHDRDSVCPWCVNERVFAGETVHWEMFSPKDNRWFYVVNVPIHHLDGAMSKQSMMLDITDRKLAEEELRKANMVVENSPVVLFRCKAAPGWPVELVSKNVVRFGYEPEEFLSGELTYSSIVYSRDLEKLIAETEEYSASDKGQWFQEYRIVTKEGDIRWIIDETISERNEAGLITHFEGVVIDITERRKAEERLILQQIQLRELNSTLEDRVREEVAKNREKDVMLIQQNRQAALGEMLDHIAHQWKQPLNSISLIIQYLGDSAQYDELVDDQIDEAVAKIMGLVTHMAQTIDIFREFYRPDKKKLEFNIKDAIDQALAFISPALIIQYVETELDVDPALTGFGYPKEFTQVLLNILANARDIFRTRNTENPRVRIKAFSEGGLSVVTIADNAGGIPEMIIGKIFDIYFTTNEASGGTGIGLYMSKNIIERRMEGTLTAANITGGAQFTIRLRSADAEVIAGEFTNRH